MSRPQTQPFPWASLLVAATIIGAFFWTLRVGTAAALMQGFSPAGFWTAISLVNWPWETWVAATPLTALFVHADWSHLIGNCVFFLLFAPKIENQLGGWGTLLLFCFGGATANVAAATIAPQSLAPIIGASGATSTLIGAFLVFYPRTQIGIILPLGLYWQTVQVPGLVLIGTWAVLQLLYTVTDTGLATVAWWTHIAGFAIGVSCAALLRMSRPLRRWV